MNRIDVMKGYVPPYLLTAKEYKSIIESEGAEFEQIRNDIDSILE